MLRYILLFGTLSLVGCGDGKATVNGKVTFDGTPVSDGAVTFIKEDDKSREGAVIKDGSFKVRMPPGKYRVEVSAQKQTGKRVQKGFDGKDEEIILREEYIPERYNTKSELMKDVASGSSSMELALTSKK